MRPNISNVHSLPGTLLIFDGPDGAWKTTQIRVLTKLLRKLGKKVTVSEWKSEVIGQFLHTNDALKKSDERILPETNLFLQTADFLYRLEREVIPALKKNHIVILDRWLHTILVRGIMIGMDEANQLEQWLFWWRNTIYKELFDHAYKVYVTISLDESLKRLGKRAESLQVKKHHTEGTILTLSFINTLVYAPDGKKLTRHDRQMYVKRTQARIIDTYAHVFSDIDANTIILDGECDRKSMKKNLEEKVIDIIL